MNSIIMKVWKNNSTGQLFITIPKDSDIRDGDYVSIEKVNLPNEAK